MNHRNGDDSSSGHCGFSNKETNQNKCDTLEDGTTAFMKWMGSSNKKSLTSDNPIILIKIVKGNHALLYDTRLSMPVKVKLTEGIFFCTSCESDECAHVGFTIRLDQLSRKQSL